MKKCENCGFENNNSELYCVNCQHKLQGADELLARDQGLKLLKVKTANNIILAFRLICVLLLFIIMCLVISSTRKIEIIIFTFFLFLAIGLILFAPFKVTHDLCFRELVDSFFGNLGAIAKKYKGVLLMYAFFVLVAIICALIFK